MTFFKSHKESLYKTAVNYIPAEIECLRRDFYNFLIVQKHSRRAKSQMR